MSETCGSGCSLYICPTSGETECIEHGGFDACCDHPRCPSRMTADHPTREERYAADAEAAWLDYRNDYLRQNPWCDPRRAGRQMRKREFVAGYVAAALVAADPAPAQPDAAWPCDNHGEPNTCLSLRKAEAECCRVCRIRAADRILHAAQPVPAPRSPYPGPCESFWHGAPGHECIPVPAPEVSRGVAEAVREFVHWVAINRAYNGSDHKCGQSLYNECLNGVLPEWAEEWLRDALPAEGGES